MAESVRPVTLSPEDVDRLLSVIRLGDADMLGWWRSRSVDETAEYVLGGAFPTTWMATGLELAMESARLRHEAALERPVGSTPAVHVWSDYLPFHQLMRSWLIECKLEQDFAALEWTRVATVPALRTRLEGAVSGEVRGTGVYLGDLRSLDLQSASKLRQVSLELAAAYASMAEDFKAPYFDLIN